MEVDELVSTADDLAVEPLEQAEPGEPGKKKHKQKEKDKEKKKHKHKHKKEKHKGEPVANGNADEVPSHCFHHASVSGSMSPCLLSRFSRILLRSWLARIAVYVAPRRPPRPTRPRLRRTPLQLLRLAMSRRTLFLLRTPCQRMGPQPRR